MREERRILMTEKELNGVRFNWTKTLDILCSNGFSQFLDNRTGEEFEIWLSGGGIGVLDNITYGWGASKVAIIDEDNDWVLKIPFCNKSKDYCQLEAIYYGQAVKEGVEEPFAECYFLMEYEGAPCYIMEKVNCDEQAIESDFYEICSDKLSGQMSEDEINDYLGSMDTDEILDQILEFYYEAGFLQKVNVFLSENSINDLHTGNLGYRGDKLVFVDYSGYHS
jgi:hypothetical protein